MTEAPPKQPLSPHDAQLLQQLVDKLTGWHMLLGMGKPGAKQLRLHLRKELDEYKTILTRGTR